MCSGSSDPLQEVNSFMCVAIPSRVISIEGDNAVVDSMGVERTVSLLLMPEPVAVGDYLCIMANTYAVERLSAEAAALTLADLRASLALAGE